MGRKDGIELSRYRTIHTIVTEHLRQAIVNGHLKPGQRLNQDELAAQYGVSRMPVREALRTLEAEGYVKIHPYRGIAVTELTAEEIEEIFSIRILLEGWATRMAAMRITDDALGRLREQLDELEVAQTTPARYLVSNQAFHKVIFHAARQPRLRALTMNLRNVVEPYLRIYLSSEGQTHRSHVAHTALYEALSARDADRAERLAEEHLRQGLDALLSNLPHVEELADSGSE